MRIDQTLSDAKKSELQTFLIDRFRTLEEQRSQFDDDVIQEIELYNNIDRKIDAKQEWEEKIKVPYIYTIIQTMVARILQTLFGHQNYVKIFVEDENFRDIEREITDWVQEELDKIGFKKRARDFIEESLVQRVVWLQLRPIPVTERDKKGVDVKGYKIEWDILKFIDVWWDVRAKEVMDTDYFVRKRKKLFQIKGQSDKYFNLEKVRHDPDPESATSTSNDSSSDIRRKEYRAKHSSAISNNVLGPEINQNIRRNNATDELEILEYYGTYDFSDKNIDDEDWKPDFKEVICTIANRQTLIRVDVVDIDIKRKRLMFPIRPLRQSNSLIGKSVPQLVGDQQHELNESRSLRMQNFKTQIKLLFKYNKNADIDFDEIFAGGGNAIGHDGNAADIDVFNVPNMVQVASLMGSQIIGDMQNATGAVDFVTGQNTGQSGQTDTAGGIRTITEQALFKFSMMSENVYDDIQEFINYVIILLIENSRDLILLKHPKLAPFIENIPKDLEDSFIIDIALKDLSQRRDVEQNQWANMMGIIEPLLRQAGGNSKELLRQFMEVFQMRGIDKLLEGEDPNAIIQKLASNPEFAQQVMQGLAQLQQEGASGKQAQQTQNPAGIPGGTAVERAANENLST